jgi:hypothetical protein
MKYGNILSSVNLYYFIKLVDILLNAGIEPTTGCQKSSFEYNFTTHPAHYVRATGSNIFIPDVPNINILIPQCSPLPKLVHKRFKSQCVFGRVDEEFSVRESWLESRVTG